MSHNNDVFKFEVGDLVQRRTWDAASRKLGVVVETGENAFAGAPVEDCVKVCWQDNYGSYWAKPQALILIAKAKGK